MLQVQGVVREHDAELGMLHRQMAEVQARLPARSPLRSAAEAAVRLASDGIPDVRRRLSSGAA